MKRAAAFFRRCAGAFLRDASGATASEFALVVPFFILVVFGTINTCLAMAAVINIHYAAERTARCLSVNVTGNCDDIDSYAKNWYRGPAVTGLVFSGSLDASCGNLVTGTGKYAIITGFDATEVEISARACYPVI